MNIEGTTVTADPRKGIITLRKSDDGLMHLIWKERNSGGVEDDLIVFEGDASMTRLEQCQDGYAMLLEFTQTGRKLFFYSQEPRKKGLGWDDTTKEKELLDRANGILTGGSAPAPATAGPGAGALGMTHTELMAMLAGGAVPAAPSEAAPAAAVPSATADSQSGTQPTAPAAGGFDVSAALGAVGGAAAAPTAPAGGAAAPFSADSISSILGNIGTAPAQPAAGAAPGAFSADAISSILGNIGAAGQQQPLSLGDVLRPENAVGAVDSAMDASLREHLPPGGNVAETTAESLTTPQVAQVCALAA